MLIICPVHLSWKFCYFHMYILENIPSLEMFLMVEIWIWFSSFWYSESVLGSSPQIFIQSLLQGEERGVNGFSTLNSYKKRYFSYGGIFKWLILWNIFCEYMFAREDCIYGGICNQWIGAIAILFGARTKEKQQLSGKWYSARKSK